MLTIVVLGSAAGGGIPQWNCGCPNCRAARETPWLRSGQTSLAASADGGRNWFLVNASPDLRQQLISTPHMAPAEGELRQSPVAGVILTNGEIDAVAGLLSMREGTRFSIYAHRRVLETLDDNSIFNVLDRERVPRKPLAIGVPFSPELPDGTPSGLHVEAFEVPGKAAWYLEQDQATAARAEGDTVGLTLRDLEGRAAHVIAACGAVTSEIRQRLSNAELVFFDGTLWRDDEMIRGGLGSRTGQMMGHVSMSGTDGAIERLADLGIRTKVFVHINNSNPVVMPGSPERCAAERAGWIVPEPGREFAL
jgi:pyrroloquinoline quinone biosynthesis protein B